MDSVLSFFLNMWVMFVCSQIHHSYIPLVSTHDYVLESCRYVLPHNPTRYRLNSLVTDLFVSSTLTTIAAGVLIAPYLKDILRGVFLEIVELCLQKLPFMLLD